MLWLNNIVDELVKRHPGGDIIVSSGVSPSGTYHLGTLREVLTAEVIMRELQRRGHKAQHLHIVDDLDVLRKIPKDVPGEFEKYLGRPLCDIPAPDGSNRSYADYFLSDLTDAAAGLHLEMQVIRAHQKYREGFFDSAIEKTLNNAEEIKNILTSVSGHNLGDNWSPVQVVEDGYLKNRKFIKLIPDKKQIVYEDGEGKERTADYQKGEVKLNWRIDWPARWWLLGVQAEPFGRDHATKGGSYDTGAAIVKQVFGADPPLPVPYNFINRTGDTKKMSKSAGDAVTASDLLKILPGEVVWFFILRYGPEKLLFFDDTETLTRLFDEFGALLAKPDKSQQEQQLIDICQQGIDKPIVSRIPFSHLVASYQASLKDTDKTLEVIKRTEHSKAAEEDAEIIRKELTFIDEWLKTRAPEDVKFELKEALDTNGFNDSEKAFLLSLGEAVANAPADADGSYYHDKIYGFKDSSGLEPKEMFSALYRAIIGKESGPRAGWFLSILPRDWLIKRLKLEG